MMYLFDLMVLCEYDICGIIGEMLGVEDVCVIGWGFVMLL